MSIPPDLDPSRPAAKRSVYRPELDVLRFIAFFGVFLFHTDYYPATDLSGLRRASSQPGLIALEVATLRFAWTRSSCSEGSHKLAHSRSIHRSRITKE
jgi:hypothetical protein